MSRIVPPRFSWSATRAGMLRDCPRLYFFNYYLASGNALGATPQAAAEARRLKALTTLPLWVGSHVHDALERAIGRCRAEGGVPEPAAAVDEMLRRMRADYRASLENHAAEAERPGDFCRFQEHEYGPEPPREDWKRRTDEAAAMVEAAFRHGYILRIAASPRMRSVEQLCRRAVDGVTVFIKIDVAFDDADGRTQILDWKTGVHKHGENPLQMMGYAAYALESWKIEPDRLDVMEVFLRHEEAAEREERCRIDAASLAAADAEIRASIDAMLALLPDPALDRLDADSCAPLPERWKCKGCAFRKLCPEGLAVLDAAGAAPATDPPA